MKSLKNTIGLGAVLATILLSGCATTMENQEEKSVAPKSDLTKAVELLIRDVGSIKSELREVKTEINTNRAVTNEIVNTLNSVIAPAPVESTPATQAK